MNSYMKNFLIIIIAIIFSTLAVSCNKTKKQQNANPIVTDLLEKDVLDYTIIRNEHKGKILVVNFFASWCPPCKAETPSFVRVYNKYKDKNFVIVGYSIDENKNDAIDFVNNYGIEFPIYLASKSMQKMYNVSKVPTTFIYDEAGTLMEVIPGMLSETSLENIAQMAVQK